MANLYDDGDDATLEIVYEDDAGEPVDPVGLTLYIERYDGTVETIAKASLLNPTPGTWTYEDTAQGSPNGMTRTWYRFEATDPNESEQLYYLVRRKRAVPA